MDGYTSCRLANGGDVAPWRTTEDLVQPCVRGARMLFGQESSPTGVAPVFVRRAKWAHVSRPRERWDKTVQTRS